MPGQSNLIQPIANRFCSALQIDPWKAQLGRKLITLRAVRHLGEELLHPYWDRTAHLQQVEGWTACVDPRDSPLPPIHQLDATPPGLTTGSEMIQQRLEVGVLLCVKIKSYTMSFLASNRGKVAGY